MPRLYITVIVSLWAGLSLQPLFGQTTSSVRRAEWSELLPSVQTRGMLGFYTRLLPDSLGFVWIGTPQGLVRRDQSNQEVLLTAKDGLLLDTVADIFEDSRGQIWLGYNVQFGARQTGVSTWDGTGVHTVLSVAQDPQWIAESGDFVEDLSHHRVYFHINFKLCFANTDGSAPSCISDATTGPDLRGISVASDGSRIWMISRTEIVEVDADQLHVTCRYDLSALKLNQTTDDEISSHTADHEGHLVVASWSGRVRAVSDGDIQTVFEPGSTLSERIRFLGYDGKGRLVAGSDSGFSWISAGSRVNIPTDDASRSVGGDSAFVDQRARIWARDTRSVYLLDGDRIVRSFDAPSLIDDDRLELLGVGASGLAVAITTTGKLYKEALPAFDYVRPFKGEYLSQTLTPGQGATDFWGLCEKAGVFRYDPTNGELTEVDLRSPSEEFIGRRIGRFGTKGIWLTANGRALALIDRRQYHLSRKDNNKAEWTEGVGATDALALQTAVTASDGVVWLAGADGVWISRPGLFPSAERLADSPSGETLLATSSRVWLVDRAKAHWWAPANTPTPTFTKAFVGPSNAGAAQAVLEEKPDVFWFGWPRGAKVWRLSGDRVEDLTPGKFEDFSHVEFIQKTKRSSVWVGFGGWPGTFDVSLARYASSGTVALGKGTPVAGRLARSMTEDNDGNLWFGMEELGVVRAGPDTKDGSGIQLFGTDSGLPSLNYLQVYFDPVSSILWVATLKGLFELADSHWVLVPGSDRYPDARWGSIDGMGSIASGDVWFYGSGGIVLGRRGQTAPTLVADGTRIQDFPFGYYVAAKGASFDAKSENLEYAISIDRAGWSPWRHRNWWLLPVWSLALGPHEIAIRARDPSTNGESEALVTRISATSADRIVTGAVLILFLMAITIPMLVFRTALIFYLRRRFGAAWRFVDVPATLEMRLSIRDQSEVIIAVTDRSHAASTSFFETSTSVQVSQLTSVAAHATMLNDGTPERSRDYALELRRALGWTPKLDTLAFQSGASIQFLLDETLGDNLFELLSQGNRTDDRVLGQSAAMGRLFLGDVIGTPALSSAARLRAIIVADPDGTLPAAAQEGRKLGAMFRRRGIDAKQLGGQETGFEQFEQELRRGSTPTIVHFAGHVRRTADKQSLRFRNADVSADDFVRVCRDTRSTALVFLNGCASAGSGTGWLGANLGSMFIRSGIPFVGTTWEVKDDVALDFAERFYDSFLPPPLANGGQTLGLALLHARQKLAAKLWYNHIYFGKVGYRLDLTRAPRKLSEDATD